MRSIFLVLPALLSSAACVLAVDAPLAQMPPASSDATKMRGADWVLEQLAQAEPTPTPTSQASAPRNVLAAYRSELVNFGGRAATLPAPEAARAWLVLADKFRRVRRAPNSSEQQQKPLSFAEVVAVLPPPASWGHLATVIEKRRAARPNFHDAALSLLAHALRGDKIAQQGDLQTLTKLARSGKPSAYALQIALQLDEALDDGNDPRAIRQRIQRRVAAQVNGSSNELNLPDLVTQIGRPAAADLIRKALVSRALIRIPVGDQTQKLARQIALQMVPKMAIPQWNMAHWVDSTALYEALNARFSKAKPKPNDHYDDYNIQTARGHAQTYYLLGLIASRRTDAAIAFATRLGRAKGNGGGEEVLNFDDYQNAFATLDRIGYSVALRDFLSGLLAKNPDLPFWNTYIEIATRSGDNAKMLSLVRTAANRPNLSAPSRQILRGHLVRALLAVDQVDEAVVQLRRLMPVAGAKADVSQTQTMTQVSHAVLLAQLGQLLERPQWTREGLDAAFNAQARMPDGKFSLHNVLIPLLHESGRDADAEALLTRDLKSSMRQVNQSHGSSYERSTLRSSLISLAGLYQQNGRAADVLALLQDAPGWGARDLAEIYTRNGLQRRPLGYIAAWALIQSGERERPATILRALLREQPGFDAAYQLLSDLQGAAALPFLEELTRRDRWEERPLIWKAHLLHKAGRGEEAEKAARAAIAIDPSDGEQGKDDRLRAYAVLADVLEARGQNEEAGRMRGAVRAIRLSEAADDFQSAGLFSRAIAMYEKSLTYFADAYCVQSRLALQLTQSGQTARAEAHYRRAYELMPVSFGRMESHCFGCERAFGGRRAQGIAEGVFSGFVARQPTNPRVHYLLAYLREEQGRSVEALSLLRRAVALDRDYINAWSRIGGIGERIGLNRKLRDEVAFNLLRLDPQSRHTSPQLSEVSNLKVLYLSVEAAHRKVSPNTPRELLPLPAARAEIEEQEAKKRAMTVEERMRSGDWADQSDQYDYDPYGDYRRPALKSAGQVLAEHKIVALASQFASL